MLKPEIRIKYPEVPREILEKFLKFIELLWKWNKKINLISKSSSKNEILERHALDSFQLADFIPDKNAKIVDIGSGAGFPGIILALSGYEDCTLIEQNSKKSIFLKNAALEFEVKAKILQEDAAKTSGFTADFITSRAMASISKILEITQNITDKNTTFLFLKSTNQKHEIDEISKKWTFELQEYKNKYNNEGVVIELKNLKKLNV